uniref:Uncharacterized protein n=1 Tax=Monopterus albus TaxID=43700 RepID=A0A3Q3K8K7_MONAL|nr:zinc finger protein 331-like [Monopterus albus]
MCSVVGCDSWRRSVQRFKLPEDPERRLEWVQFLFEANSQRLKESSWTDITICTEHFTYDSFLTPTGSLQLRAGAVPSRCLKPEPDEPEPKQEPVETTEVKSHDQLKTCDSPASFSEESVAVPESPVPSDTSDGPDYGQMLQNIENIDVIREKVALLQMKEMYVVNESRLFQLFGNKCPSCGSKVKVKKFIHGAFIVVNQQCLQCDYRNQWKSQVNASVPAAEDLRGGIEVFLEAKPAEDAHTNITGDSKDAVVTDEESDTGDEAGGPGDDCDMNSDDDDDDDDWSPLELHFKSDEESEDKGDGFPEVGHKIRQLCTECGVFFNKWKPHTCEYKIKPYPCNICGKRYVNELSLNAHSKIHDENYEHQCKYCSVTFKTKLDKVTHEQIHVPGRKPYKCPDCPDTFATNKRRRIHLKSHRGCTQLTCHSCGMEFYRVCSLQRHLLIHTGVKPYKCSVCQRGFNQLSHLKSHMRLHTGERPYKCQDCDKHFNHNVSLKSHVQRYHTSSSGHEQKEEETKESSTGDFQDNGIKRGAEPRLDNVDEEHDTEDEVLEERIYRAKKKRRSTGRPIGRPKSYASGNTVLAIEVEGQGAHTEAHQLQVEKLRRRQCSDEGSEDELTDSDVNFDSAEEEEERSQEAIKITERSGGKGKNSDSDSDFDPENSKEKRQRGPSLGKRRGRPRKHEVV